MTTVLNARNNPITSVNVEERKNIDIQPGDTVRVSLKIPEKGKIRIQIFEGVVLARKHGSEAGATFTVRRVVDGVGVEKIFPLFSPMIDKIEIVRRAKVRRAKLYYIRDKAVREIKRQMRRMTQVDVSTESDIARKDREAKEAAEAERLAQEVEATRQAEEAQAQEEAQKAQEESQSKTPSENPQAETPAEETPKESQEEKSE